MKNASIIVHSVFLRSRVYLYTLFFIFFYSPIAIASPPEDYPVPPDEDNRLFYLQRSTNANTVVYDANIQTSGVLNPKKPIDVYWLRYTSTGEKKALNFVQRNFAYGLNFKKTKEGNYNITLKAYSGREILVFQERSPRAPTQFSLLSAPEEEVGILHAAQQTDSGILTEECRVQSSARTTR